MVGKPAGTVEEPSHSYSPRIGFGISGADSGMARERSTTVRRLRGAVVAVAAGVVATTLGPESRLTAWASGVPGRLRSVADRATRTSVARGRVRGMGG